MTGTPAGPKSDPRPKTAYPEPADDRTAWQRRSRWSRALIVLAIATLVAMLFVQFASSATNDDRKQDTGSGGRGTSRSTRITDTYSLGAFAELARSYDYGVERVTGRLSLGEIGPSTTLFVVDADLADDAEVQAVQIFVRSGGRLVIGGSDPFDVGVFDRGAPTWSPGGRTTYRVRTPDGTGARSIASGTSGVWDDLGRSRALVGSDTAALLTGAELGAGRVFYLADSTPLSNGWLSRADNAAFGIQLIGDNRNLLLIDGVRAASQETGWRAIPSRWKVALLIALIASLVYMWAAGTRFGPPERRSRALAPARGLFVRSLAATLERTNDPAGAGEALVRNARQMVLRRAGLVASSDDADAVARAARSVGLDELDAAVLVGLPHSPDAAIRLAAVHARLTRGDLTTSTLPNPNVSTPSAESAAAPN